MELALKSKSLGKKKNKILTVLLCCALFPKIIKIRFLYCLNPLFFLLEFINNDELFDYMITFPVSFSENMFKSIISYAERFGAEKTAKIMLLNKNNDRCVFYYYHVLKRMSYIPECLVGDDLYKEVISLFFVKEKLTNFLKYHVYSEKLCDYIIDASPEIFSFALKKYGTEYINETDLIIYGTESNIKKYLEYRRFELHELEDNCLLISSPFYHYYGFYSEETVNHLISCGKSFNINAAALFFEFKTESFLCAVKNCNMQAAIYFYKKFRITDEFLMNTDSYIWQNWDEFNVFFFSNFTVLEKKFRN